MKNWLRLHAYALTSAWRHTRQPRGGFILNVLVIAIVLALPFAGFTLLDNLRSLSNKLAVESEVSVFLAMTTPRDKAQALAKPIRQILEDAKVAGRVEFIPREKALSELGTRSTVSDAVAVLGSNPLPDAYVLRLVPFENTHEADKLASISANLRALPNVDHVQLDSAWTKRLSAVMHVGRLALLFLAGVLAVVVIAVIFNTIRLQVLNQREEIEVSKLVGATNGFICRPFYYAGILLGLTSGALALGLVALALLPMNQAIAELARLYNSNFRIEWLGLGQAASLLAASTMLGLAGAVISVRRTLARISHQLFPMGNNFPFLA
ncbi:MAG: ABC transporter permease [Burkholderiales bacterium]|nr:ABC transporter permease [Burkholderiales bacterium]